MNWKEQLTRNLDSRSESRALAAASLVLIAAVSAVVGWTFVWFWHWQLGLFITFVGVLRLARYALSSDPKDRGLK